MHVGHYYEVVCNNPISDARDRQRKKDSSRIKGRSKGNPARCTSSKGQMPTYARRQRRQLVDNSSTSSAIEHVNVHSRGQILPKTGDHGKPKNGDNYDRYFDRPKHYLTRKRRDQIHKSMISKRNDKGEHTKNKNTSDTPEVVISTEKTPKEYDEDYDSDIESTSDGPKKEKRKALSQKERDRIREKSLIGDNVALMEFVTNQKAVDDQAERRAVDDTEGNTEGDAPVILFSSPRQR